MYYLKQTFISKKHRAHKFIYKNDIPVYMCIAELSNV